jgi:hypothetical protein
MLGASSRRELLSVGAGLLAALGGCTATPSESVQRVAVLQRPACAEGFRIEDRSARLGRGRPPEVSFTIRNAGDQPFDYRISVVFTQRTSTGLDVKSGETTLTGTLAPAERADLTATDDAPEVENTTGYRADVSLSCPSGN